MGDIINEIISLIDIDQNNLEIIVNRGDYQMYATSPPNAYMIRTYRAYPSIQILHKFQAEAYMLERMYQYPHIPSPNLVAGQLDESDENLLLVMERMDGIPLHKAWNYLQQSTREDLAFQFGEMLKTLHQIGVQSVGYPGSKQNWQEFLRNRLWEGIEQLRSNGVEIGLNAFRLHKLDDWLKAIEDSPPVVVHGDLNPHNVMISSVEEVPAISALIDWEWSIGAPYRYDLVEIESLFYNSPSIIKSFYEGYGRTPNHKGWEQERRLYLLDRFIQNACYYLNTGRYTKQRRKLTSFMISTLLRS